MPDAHSPWQPITTAPKDRKVDLWAKIWLADGDRFTAERFPDCRWDDGDSMCNRKASWSNLPKGYCATHWMERPDGPEADHTSRDLVAVMQDTAVAFDALAGDFAKKGHSESASALQYAAGYVRDRLAEHG